MKFRDLTKNDKIKLGLLVVASVILAVVLIANYRTSYKSTPVEKTGRKKTAIIEKMKELKAGKTEEIVKATKEKPVEIQAMLHEVGREDPFSPASENYIPEIRAELNLVGIIWDAEKPLAVINDTIVSQGDVIENKKVIKITNEGVVLSEDGREYTLRLGKPESQEKNE